MAKMRFDFGGIEFCKGLVPERTRLAAEHNHMLRVCGNHGVNFDEVALMGESFCIRLVNARRSVERAIDEAVVRATWEPVQFMHNGYRKVTLPPLPPYYPVRAVRPSLSP